MSKGVNKVIIIGNLGNDPETRTFPDGGSVANISVATSESWKDRNTGQQQTHTEWHRIVLRDRGNYKLGEIAAQYLKKGSKVYVEGHLKTRKWQDNQGQDRYTTEIIADHMQMLDGRDERENSYQQAQQQMPQAPPQPQAPQQPPVDTSGFDDDIPF